MHSRKNFSKATFGGLESHKFTTFVLEQKQIGTYRGKDEEKASFIISQDKNYQIRVSYRIIQLLIWCRQLSSIPVYLSVAIKQMKKYKPEEIELIIYHIENYYMRANSIEDKLLQLENTLLNLKIDEQALYYKTFSKKFQKLIEASRVGDKKQLIKLFSFTQSFHRQMEEVRVERHALNHRRSIQDNDINQLKSFIYLIDIKKLGKDRKESYKDLLEMKRGKIMQKYLKKIKQYNKEIFKTCSTIFSQLLPIYEKNSINLYLQLLESNKINK